MTMIQRARRNEIQPAQTWDTRDLFPTNTDWQAALTALQTDISLVTTYQGKLGSSAKTLLEALQAYEDYSERLDRVATYATLQISTDGSNADYQGDAAKTGAAFAMIYAELAFFDSELLTIPATTIAAYITELPALHTYKKMLDDIIETGKYKLSPEIEKVLAALGEVHDAPFMTYERSKTADMVFEDITDDAGQVLPMSEALYEDRYEIDASTDIRKQAYTSYVKTFKQYKNTYAATYATEVTKQVTMAKLRGYASVTDMLLEPHQVTKEMYDNQLDVIQKELAPHMRKLAKLKQADYGLDKIHFRDLKAPLDPTFQPETSYDSAKELILDSLQILGTDYSEIMEKAFTERWIDYADNIGKQTGAFCASPYGVHPYILITWTDTMRGAFTLAHELGHAGHFYLAGEHQSLINTNPSTYFVEAPSTLNELLLAEHLLKNTEDKQMKRWIISSLLDTYYHNFVTHLLEAAFQRQIYDLAEQGVPLTADLLCEQKHAVIANFWGDTVELDEGTGLTWMRQPHYYMGLYPYTYSAGLTVSTLVLQKIKAEGQTAVDGWLDVLRTGGSLKPLDLIKKAGVDMSNPNAIKEAVAYVGSLVDMLEEL